jgi:nucleotide-binding universal stress UspA family protein
MQLAARASCSVLITRNRPGVGGPIVVGVDRSAAAAGVLDFAFAAAALWGEPLVVVQAVDSVPGRARDDHHLDDLVDHVECFARTRAVAATVRARSGDPADVLCSESAQAGLVVVGPRGEHLGRGLLGPVAQTLLHHAAAPLIIVRGAMNAVPAFSLATGTRYGD